MKLSLFQLLAAFPVVLSHCTCDPATDAPSPYVSCACGTNVGHILTTIETTVPPNTHFQCEVNDENTACNCCSCEDNADDVQLSAVISVPGPVCTDVSFDEAFNADPVVLVTADHRGNPDFLGHDTVSEVASHTRFGATLCFDEPNDWDNIHHVHANLNWIAFPRNGANMPEETGTIHFGQLVSGVTVCQTQPFCYPFDDTPNFFLTVNQPDGNQDSSGLTTVWAEQASATEVKVCVHGQERSDASVTTLPSDTRVDLVAFQTLPPRIIEVGTVDFPELVDEYNYCLRQDLSVASTGQDEVSLLVFVTAHHNNHVDDDVNHVHDPISAWVEDFSWDATLGVNYIRICVDELGFEIGDTHDPISVNYMIAY